MWPTFVLNKRVHIKNAVPLPLIRSRRAALAFVAMAAVVLSFVAAPQSVASTESLSSGSMAGVDSGSASGSGASSVPAGSGAETSSDDDYFRFALGAPELAAVPAAVAGAHGDWGGRRADIGPFWMTSASTSKYVSRQFGAFWHDLPTRDSASKFTLIPDGWGTVRIKESSTGQCLRVYETSRFRQRSPLVSCEGATSDRSQEEMRWVVLPAGEGNSSTKASSREGGFILANYRNAKCLTVPGREVSTFSGYDLHLDGDCKGARAADLQVFHPEGVDADEDTILRAAITDTAINYATRNCSDGGSTTQFDCVFTPSRTDAWGSAVEVPEAVCVTEGETNNTSSPLSKEVTTREDSGWTLKVGREFTANTSLEPKLLSALGLKVSAGLKLTQDQTWTGATSTGTRMTLQTEPGHTSWVSRELRVRQVEGSWAFGISRLPWASGPGPVRVPVKDAYQLSYNSAYFNSNHPFPGCATRNKVEPLVRPSLTQVGNVLTVSPGAWPTTDWTLGYRWYKQRGAQRELITTSDAPSYTRTSSDDKATPIGVIVTAYRDGYAPTQTVIDAEPPA